MPQSSSELAKQFGGTPSSALAKQFGGVVTTASSDLPRQPGDSYAINPYDPKKPVDAPPDPGHDVARWALGFLKQMNPIAMAKGIIDLATTNPMTSGFNLGMAQYAQFQKAKDAFDQGRHVEAMGYALAGALPLVGPAAADVGETIGSGDVAGGLGEAAGLMTTVAAPGLVAAGAKVARHVPGAPTVAEMAARGSSRRMADVITPKVGANKTRFANMAIQTSERLAAEPEMGALTRSGLGQKVADQRAVLEGRLDEAAQARNPHDLIDTSVVVSALKDRLARITAHPAEGAEAHARLKSMGLSPKLPTSAPTQSAFASLPAEYQAELKRIQAELDEFPYVRLDQEPSSRAVAADPSLDYREKSFTPGIAGSPVLHDIGGTGTRVSMARTLKGYIESGQRLPTAMVKRAIEVADARIRGGPSPQPGRPLGRTMLPIEDFETAQTGPLGSPVVAAPYQSHADVITQAIADVQKLGPAATYDSLRTIRQAHDQVAKAKYNPSVTQDFQKVLGQANGSADVAGVLRETLATADPATAAINKDYSFYRKVDDVIQAAEEVDRSRPKVARTIISRLTGAIVGGQSAGRLGAVVGGILGPTLETGLKALTEGRKIVMARYLADVAKALRTGEAPAIEAALRKLRAVSVVTQSVAKSSGGSW
jgi:hypothetical protein